MSTATSTPSPTNRKIRAILAGGLVLGVGAAVTLAAWNDSEFVGGDFGAGTFNLEGSVDNATWTDSDVAGEAAVIFDLTDHGNLAPEDVVHEPFWVRLDADTTSPATLTLSGITPGEGGNEENLSYVIYADPDTCDAEGATSGVVVGSGTDLTEVTAATPVDLAIGADGAAGDAVQLCFQVTAGAGLVQGTEASAVWEFEAVSVDE